MNSILSANGQGVLEDLAARRALLAFDFDGTLAPIVGDRAAACAPSATRRMLRALSLLYPCAVVSGRARADLAARVDRIPLFAVVGTHGAEPGFGKLDRTRRAQVLSWVRILKKDLSLLPGIDVEDKWFSVAVHYRHVPARASARALVTAVASSLEGARVCRGHAVVHVVPREAPDKKAAVQEVLRRAGPRPVLYVGDDRTDEDVFSSVDVGVRVGRTARSTASWYLAAQGAIDDLLRALLAARTRVDGRGARADGLMLAVGD
jgi:trehalose 6-phosphate phosphatase